MKFLLIEPANNANAEGRRYSAEGKLKAAFKRIGILDFQKRIMGLNGASVSRLGCIMVLGYY